jgi:hypothetical protein
MIRVVATLLLVGLVVYCVVDVLRSDKDERLGVPPFLWVLLIVLLPFFGSIAWLVVSAAQRSGRAQDVPRVRPRRSGGAAPDPRPVAPDDDPEFLRSLERFRRQGGTNEGGSAA